MLRGVVDVCFADDIAYMIAPRRCFTGFITTFTSPVQQRYGVDADKASCRDKDASARYYMRRCSAVASGAMFDGAFVTTSPRDGYRRARATPSPVPRCQRPRLRHVIDIDA